MSCRLVPALPRSARWRLLLGLSLCALPALTSSPLGCNPGIDQPDAALDPDGGADVPDLSASTRLLTLDVQPNNDVLQVDLNTQASRTFKAIGKQADGQTVDLTAQVTWGVDNPAVGALTGGPGMFKTAAKATNTVDFTRVTARYNLNGTDLTGVANLTVVWLRQSGPSPDFFFSLPYKDPSQRKPLAFSTQLQSLDAFFAVDTTGSMEPAISALASSLQGTVIPGVKAAAAKDAWFGVGAIDDFPTSPYGKAGCNSPDDQPFILLKEMSGVVADATSGVSQLLRPTGGTRGCGADLPEGQMEALYQIATGAGQSTGGASVPANHKGIGGVAFRDGALPVITVITDAVFHTMNEPTLTCGGTRTDYVSPPVAGAHSRADTTAALNKICAKVVGVSVIRAGEGADCLATRDLVQFAKDTGALVPPEAWDVTGRPAGCAKGQCCTGAGGAGEAPDATGLCPLAFKVAANGGGLGAQVSAGISQLARFASFDVVTDVSGTTTGEKGATLPAPHTTVDFIKAVLPASATPPPPPPTIPAPVIVGNKFTKVVPGSGVTFNIDAQNDFLMPAQVPQVFHATIRVRAGGCANLDQRDVIILIPPSAPILG